MPELNAWKLADPNHKVVTVDIFPKTTPAFFEMGVLDVAIGQSFYNMGYESVQNLYKLIQGEDPGLEYDPAFSSTPVFRSLPSTTTRPSWVWSNSLNCTNPSAGQKPGRIFMHKNSGDSGKRLIFLKRGDTITKISKTNVFLWRSLSGDRFDTIPKGER